MLPVRHRTSFRRCCNAFLQNRIAVQESSSRGSWLVAHASKMRQYATLLQSINRSPLSTRMNISDHYPVKRSFNTESDYHTAADESLEDIQDAVEEALEDNGIPEFEVTLASGVLTLVFPPHGTWVINKQTPNRQLWWSSPISGPRRYEYESGDWIFTRDESHSMTLNQTLKDEINEIYQVEIDL